MSDVPRRSWRSLRDDLQSSLHFSILGYAGLSLALRVAGLGLSYVANLLLSRGLGIDEYGSYAIALSWALVLTLAAKAGFDSSALKYAAIYHESGDTSRLRGFVQFAVLVITIIWSAIVLALFTVGDRIISAIPRTILFAGLLILPLALLAFGSVLLRTMQRIFASQFYEQILRPGLLIIGLLGAVIWQIHLDSSAGMALTALAAWGALLALSFHLQNAMGDVKSVAARFDQWREWAAISVPMLALSVVQELMNQIEVILLGQLAEPRQAAVFSASWRLASLVPFSLVGLATIAGPMIARAHNRGSFNELQQIAKVVARSGFALAVISAGILYFYRMPLLHMFGPGFDSGDAVVTILLISGIANSFTGVVAYLITLTGHERVALLIFVFALSVSVGLNTLLIPRFGAVGAAWASTSAMIFWNLAMLVYVRLSLGLDASAIGSARLDFHNR